MKENFKKKLSLNKFKVTSLDLRNAIGGITDPVASCIPGCPTKTCSPGCIVTDNEITCNNTCRIPCE